MSTLRLEHRHRTSRLCWDKHHLLLRVLNLAPATLSAKVSEISKLLIEVGAEVCQRLPTPIGMVNFSRRVKNTDGTVCLAYTVPANFDRECEPEHRGLEYLFWTLVLVWMKPSDWTCPWKQLFFPLLPHGLDVKAVEEMESKWDSGERGPIYPQWCWSNSKWRILHVQMSERDKDRLPGCACSVWQWLEYAASSSCLLPVVKFLELL